MFECSYMDRDLFDISSDEEEEKHENYSVAKIKTLGKDFIEVVNIQPNVCTIIKYNILTLKFHKSSINSSIHYTFNMQKKVMVEITIKRIDPKEPWYYARCGKCKIEILLEGERYKCTECKRIIPHPEKRYYAALFDFLHYFLFNIMTKKSNFGKAGLGYMLTAQILQDVLVS